MTDQEKNYLISKVKTKEIIMIMNGMSEEGFNNRMLNDPYFAKGFDTLVNLFMKSGVFMKEGGLEKQNQYFREALRFYERRLRLLEGINGTTSDGYHTFDELYYHRMILFSVICNQNKEKAWKSRKHHDGTMFDDHFIVGIETPEGQYTYHYHKDYWDVFEVKEMSRAPEWDGHKPKDITRLLTLV